MTKAKAHVVDRERAKMNDYERAYVDEVLDPLLRARRIVRWDFQPCKLRLADNSFYTPDFRVVNINHFVEFHEVKGWWREDARLKIKYAAEAHPYVFLAIMVKKVAKKRGGGWTFSKPEVF